MKLILVGLLFTSTAALAGGISQESVTETMSGGHGKFSECYAKEGSKGQPSGSLKLKISVGGEGKVVSCDVGESTLKNPDLDKCICGSVMALKFEVPEGGGHVEIDYPLAFAPDKDSKKVVAEKPAKKKKKGH